VVDAFNDSEVIDRRDHDSPLGADFSFGIVQISDLIQKFRTQITDDILRLVEPVAKARIWKEAA
jgi:hypothetical protein